MSAPDFVPLIPASVVALLEQFGHDTPLLRRWAAEQDRHALVGRNVQQGKPDWALILDDLRAGGINGAMVARKLDVKRSTVGRWRKGQEPSFGTGAKLIALHAATRARNK